MLLGPHVNREYVPASRPIHEHIEAARQAALDEAGVAIGAVAIFVGGPRTLRISLDDAEADELRAYLARHRLRCLAHSAYVATPWGANRDASLAFIQAELRACARAGIAGLVVHLPRAPPEAAAAVLLQLAETLSRARAPLPLVYLETPAVVDSHYDSPEKLHTLLALLGESAAHFGVCIDTAHLWTSGVSLRSRAEAEGWLAGLARLRRPLAFHLNDSACARGTGPDTHAPLGAGQIWAHERGGLRAVLEYARAHHCPVILERKPRGAILDDYHLISKIFG